jgi:hypothetical protein
MFEIIVTIILLAFSITNIVLIEEEKKNEKSNGNQNADKDSFLIIGEAISGISLIYLLLKNLSALNI